MMTLTNNSLVKPQPTADDEITIMVVAGPTASGKTALAIDMAKEFNGVIINADSMQVYKDLSIVTARPDKEEERQADHRLFGMLEGRQSCSAGQWRDMAEAEIMSAHKVGRLPIVVGGTGMYIRSLMQGMAAIPAVPPSIRYEIQMKLDNAGHDALHTELKDLDPESAARIKPGDTQRLIRAHEVLRATGKTLSHWQSIGNTGKLRNADFKVITLMPPRKTLYDYIDARFVKMVENGAVEEVMALVEKGIDPALPVMKAVGVREIAAWQRGEMTKEEAISKSQQASRNYAKRQLTWFKNQIPEAKAVFAQYSESQRAKIFAFIRQEVLTP